MEQRGNYQINVIDDLGKGGFGRVELVELYTLSGKLCRGNGLHNGRYARKVLAVREDFIDKPYSAADWKRRFQREVEYQAGCKHTNIVPIFMYNLDVEQPWFIMELAEDNLRNDLRYGMLASDGQRVHLSSYQKIEIIRMMLEGVKHIHEKGYIHRDLKPENILRYKDGLYKISDFGLIKNTDKASESEMISNIQVVMGTDGYMSPESKRGFSNERSDIYSLGVIIDQMGISDIKGIDEIVKVSTLYKAGHRYNSVSEMLEVLDGIQPRSKA